MKIETTALDGVLVLEPEVFADSRGAFFESFNATAFRQATGFDGAFVQDNQSRSIRNVLRGAGVLTLVALGVSIAAMTRRRQSHA